MDKLKYIPFHRASVGNEEIKMASKAIRSGWLTMGQMTVEFEDKFKAYTGAKYAIAVNSCTAALHLALEAISLKEGDEVIVPAITFTATAEVVCYFKAKPIFVDVERDTLNIDHMKIESKITSRTKAIIVVDYGGQPANYTEIKKIARKNKLFIIEDAAHTLPSWYKGRKVGTLADITCFSFYATKTLATGEGGMITTNNPVWARRMKIMRLHGINKDVWKRYDKGGNWYYEIVDAGYKYNTTDINSAIGIVQLKKLESMWRKRKAIAKIYGLGFKNIPEIIIPTIRNDRITSWHLYVIKLSLDKLSIDRAEFIKMLLKEGICVSVHFIPLYKQPFYKNKFKYTSVGFPNSEWAFKRIISLPIYPGMSGTKVKKVIKTIKKIVDNHKNV